jgi:cyanophycinase
MPTTFLRRYTLALPILLCLSLSAQAQWLPHMRLYAIGGGYETALKGYVAEVMRHAHGPVVKIVMVPAAFADDPVLPEDPVILAEDVAALQAACDAVVNKHAFPGGCKVSSVPLYVAADAHNDSIVGTLRDATLDGIFFNGGDQAYAMRVLALTPAEAAMNTAAERGVVFGGTSAGAAIESLVMNAGYTDTGDSTTALQKASIDMWMGQTRASRGLPFGSQQVVLDQHVYARGRLGRMLNASAQTADALGDGGLLGFGLDYDTGAAINNDRSLRSVFGVSSAVVVDFQTAHARYSWVGPNEALSARSVLTHLLPPSQSLSFDLAQRVPALGNHRFEWQRPTPNPQRLHVDGRATLILGGDVSEDLAGPVIQELVKQATVKAGAKEGGKFLLLAVGYAEPTDAQSQAEDYATALTAAGWKGTSEIHVYGQDPLDPIWLKGASGVLVLGGDQSRLDSAIADPGFHAFLNRAARDSQVLMLEHAMAAAAGDAYCAVGEDASGDDAIAAFRVNAAVIKSGLGLVRGAAFEPRLQTDMRWGRLYGLGAQKRQTAIYGISESSAIMIRGNRATVVGQNPVVALDARGASFFPGDNGTLGAFNVLMDVFEPDEELNH